MVIDNPHCLRDVVKKTHPYPTHEGAEFIIENSALVDHLDNYSKGLVSSLGKGICWIARRKEELRPD